MTGAAAPGAPGTCLDWACAGRPLPGETVSGDLAVHLALDGGAVLAVIDGLGHGVEAAAAAARAREVVVATAAEVPIDEVLVLAHGALLRTRGVAMTIASVRCAGQMTWVGVGNVEAYHLRSDGNRAVRAASAVLYGGVVGYRLPRVRVSTVDLEPGDLVVMATDGIAPDFTDHVAPADPVDRIAAAILARCARANDDALVAAARYVGTSP
jgi:hypothetical protein